MNNELKKQVAGLRQRGLTYSEIQARLLKKIPKSTLAYMCQGVTLKEEQKSRIRLKIIRALSVARKKSAISARKRRLDRSHRLLQKNLNLGKIIQQVKVAKVALAMLFLGEGSKTHASTVMFGNSSPQVIKLFLKFFRQCYTLDESKFRCTVQCRANQNIEELKRFWSGITKIPQKQFYKTQIDPRTAGKPMKNFDYKGVCRLDYLSAETVCDLHQSIKAIELAGL